MPLTLTPQIEEDLAVVAKQRGLPPEEALAQVIAEAWAKVERERREAIEGVRRSEADFDAGRSLSLKELDARLDVTIEAKRRERSP
ncbi:MAG: hypothetical protein M3Y28_03845 [Armatimonadota bacterium]|nr:hypothetical protein [Armatimonadota bacterium]